jgi:hypothetical protein
MAAPTTLSVLDAATMAERKKERERARARHEGMIAIDWLHGDAREGMAKEGRCKVKTKTRLLVKASDNGETKEQVGSRS